MFDFASTHSPILSEKLRLCFLDFLIVWFNKLLGGNYPTTPPCTSLPYPLATSDNEVEYRYSLLNGGDTF